MREYTRLFIEILFITFLLFYDYSILPQIDNQWLSAGFILILFILFSPINWLMSARKQGTISSVHSRLIVIMYSLGLLMTFKITGLQSSNDISLQNPFLWLVIGLSFTPEVRFYTGKLKRNS